MGFMIGLPLSGPQQQRCLDCFGTLHIPRKYQGHTLALLAYFLFDRNLTTS